MRYKPTGWRKESHRHSLAAKGIKTRYDAKKFSDLIETRTVGRPAKDGMFGTGVSDVKIKMVDQEAEYIDISFDTSDDEGMVAITIEDDGSGMDNVVDVMIPLPDLPTKQDVDQYIKEVQAGLTQRGVEVKKAAEIARTIANNAQEKWKEIESLDNVIVKPVEQKRDRERAKMQQADISAQEISKLNTEAGFGTELKSDAKLRKQEEKLQKKLERIKKTVPDEKDSKIPSPRNMISSARSKASQGLEDLRNFDVEESAFKKASEVEKEIEDIKSKRRDIMKRRRNVLDQRNEALRLPNTNTMVEDRGI